ncbi:NAD(+) salvage pathway protein [Pseudocyphellaria aurata]|nr:NAD(+) salvage pathway protein [Pseudocyphellaria aurata]
MTGTRDDKAGTTALLVIDMQEDFCPPNGSLAVEGGRAVAPAINVLLSLPYALKIATRDSHPNDHVSFDTSHPPPNNKPFESSVTITNPVNPTESKEIPIWPAHCIQSTKGAEIIPEIATSKFDVIVTKGLDKTVEMFSAFADVFGNKAEAAASLDLAAFLKDHAIHRVHIVGIAGDFCVKHSALDASRDGFEVFVIDEGVRSVHANGWEAARSEFQSAGIQVVSIEDPEITALM